MRCGRGQRGSIGNLLATLGKCERIIVTLKAKLVSATTAPELELGPSNWQVRSNGAMETDSPAARLLGRDDRHYPGPLPPAGTPV